MRGFPFQMNPLRNKIGTVFKYSVFVKRDSLKNTEYLKTSPIVLFKGFHLKRKSSQGDLKQETYRKVVL